MRVDVCNRSMAVGLLPSEGSVVISISGPADPAPLLEGWADVLRLEFHDIVEPVDDGKPYVLFGAEHAEEIHAFVEANLDKDFVVHCDAGVSRSVAVGVFLRDVYEANLVTHEIPVRFADKTANSRVLSILKRKFWVEHFED